MLTHADVKLIDALYEDFVRFNKMSAWTRRNTLDRGSQPRSQGDLLSPGKNRPSQDNAYNRSHEGPLAQNSHRGRRSSAAQKEGDTFSRRDSYGRARSQPHKQPSITNSSSNEDRRNSISRQEERDTDQQTFYNRKRSSLGQKMQLESESGTRVEVTIPQEVRRRSIDDSDYEVHRRKRKHKESLETVEVTRHMLFKEALYTAVHTLGRATKRFPSSKEEMSLYVVQTFCDSQKEEHAVIEHVKGDSYPVTIVNTKVKRGDGLQSLENERLPNPYCVVATQEDDQSTVVFQLGKKDWPKYISPNPLQRIKSLILPSTGLKKKNSQPLPEHRKSQVYEKVVAFKTTVQHQTSTPVWEQKFQVLISKPSTNILTVEVWNLPSEQQLIGAMQSYKAQSSDGKRSWNSSSETKNRKSKGGSKSPVNDRKGSLVVISSGRDTVEDDYLGKVSIKVSDLACEGLENWFYLEGKTRARDKEVHGKLRIALWLVHAFRHGRHYVELVEPKVMLECMWDWILGVEKSKNGPGWDGSLCQPATCLLFQYALQNGISDDTHAVIRWNAYAKHKLTLHEIGTALNDLDGALERKVSVRRLSLIKNASDSSTDEKLLPTTLTREDSQEQIEESFLTIMKTKILPVIRNHLKEPEENVTEACKSFKKLKDVLSKFDFSPALHRIIWLFENAIRLCILEWYQAMFADTVHIIPGIKRYELVYFYVEVMNQVIELIKLGFAKWGKVFYLNCETEYMTVVYDELQKMVNHDVEPTCWSMLEYYHDNHRLRRILLTEDKNEEMLCKALSSLYFTTQIFVEMKDEMDATQHLNPKDGAPNYCNLQLYHRWFRPILVLWLGFAVVRGSEMITKCINIDNASVDNIQTKTSTSALDTANVFHQMVDFWKKLRWPDISENYVIVHFLIEVMCYYTVLYAKRKHDKLELEGYFDTQDRFDISERLCTALNNIEYVKDYLEKVPIEISLEQLLSALEAECGKTKDTQAYRNRLNFVLTLTYANVETIFKTILTGLGNRIRPEMTLYVQEALDILRNSPETDAVRLLEEAREPILTYLETNIVTLHESLLELNFARLLQLFWNVLNQEIRKLSPLFRMRDLDEQVAFFTRIVQLYPVLEEYFMGGDAGLTKEELNTLDYKETITLIKYYTQGTNRLIGIHYKTRGYDQIKNGIMTQRNKTKPKFGHLTVRINYWDKKLTIEVISASDLLATDDSFHLWDLCKKRTPSTDPFVEVDMKPSDNFSNVRLSKTETRWKTLHPIYNEKFQWDVTLTECLQENAVVVFTVKDYDFLSKNDFLGEAIVPLALIPGVASKPLPQPMQLHLRVVEPSSALQVLQSRHWDMEASRFMTHQSHRFSIL